MVKRRSAVAMTDTEVGVFLEESRTMVLASILPGGRPHLVAMWYALIDGTVWCWTYRSSQKAVNLARDPRITALVEAGESYEELRGVTLYATAHLHREIEAVERVGSALLARYSIGNVEPADFLASAPKRVAVSLEVGRVASWDHRKLGGRY